jgi:hypothetical protein
VRRKRLFTFLPIGQRDDWEYATPPDHPNAASLATVYTMIARAIGIAQNREGLSAVTIDKYWDDASKTATWHGQLAKRATLGALTPLAGDARLNESNVIGEMRLGRLAILRGSFTRGNGSTGEHFMLGTLYTPYTDGDRGAVVANDPFTGQQVLIDRVTRRVFWPSDFPLADFTVDGYQPVTLN